MNRIHGTSSHRNASHARKIRCAGEMAQKGSYVCVHCNSHSAMEHNGQLPLCRCCYGRRFKQL
jgi:hypothetical protein